MNARDTTISRNKREKFQANNPKSDKEISVPKDKEHTHGIDRLNLGDPEVKSEIDSEVESENDSK